MEQALQSLSIKSGMYAPTLDLYTRDIGQLRADVGLDALRVFISDWANSSVNPTLSAAFNPPPSLSSREAIDYRISILNGRESYQQTIDFIEKHAGLFASSAYVFAQAAGQSKDWTRDFCRAVRTIATALAEAWNVPTDRLQFTMPKEISIGGKTYTISYARSGKPKSFVYKTKNRDPQVFTIGENLLPEHVSPAKQLRRSWDRISSRREHSERLAKEGRLLKIFRLHSDILSLRHPEYASFSSISHSHELRSDQLIDDPIPRALFDMVDSPNSYRICKHFTSRGKFEDGLQSTDHCCQTPFFCSNRQQFCSSLCKKTYELIYGRAAYYKPGGGADTRREKNPDALRRNRRKVVC